VSTVDFLGAVAAAKGVHDIEGLNQYALPVGGIGEYTSD
jgi:hypothetical protein